MGKVAEKNNQWGDWCLDVETLTLEFKGIKGKAKIPLDQHKCMGDLFQTIFHINKKMWVTRKIIGDLVSALEDLFSPLGTFHGDGRNKRIDARQHLVDAIKERKRASVRPSYKSAIKS